MTDASIDQAWQAFWQPYPNLPNQTIIFWQVGMNAELLHNSGTPFTATQQNQIRDAIKAAFYASPELRGKLAVASSTHPLVIEPIVNGGEGDSRGNQTSDGRYYIGIDLASILGSSPTDGSYSATDGTDTTNGADGLHSWNQSGVFMPSMLSLALAHELSHAFTPNQLDIGEAVGDFNNPSSMAFHVVVDTNTVARELGLSAFQTTTAGYYANIFSNDIRFSEIQQHVSYTFDNQVDYVWLGDRAWSARVSTDYNSGFWYAGRYLVDTALYSNLKKDVLDLSKSAYAGNALALGLEGSDKITTGSGNDFIYGGSGDDVLSGASGNNYINGGDLGMSVADDGLDTADYSAAPRGITLEIGSHVYVSGDPIPPGSMLVSDNGWRDPTAMDPNSANLPNFEDTVVSIETILGSKFGSDHVTIDDASLAGYSLTGGKLTIDGQGGGNSVTFAMAVNQVWTLDGIIRTGNLTLKHFSSVQFSAADDTLKLEYAHNAEGVPEVLGGARVDMGGGYNTLDLSDLKDVSVAPGFGSTANMLVVETAAFSNIDHIIATGAGYSNINFSGYDLHGRTMTLDYGSGGSLSAIGGANTSWVVNGGSGSDTVYLSGAASSYTYSGSAESFTVTATNGFTATLNNVEHVDFQSGALYDSAGHETGYDVAPIALLKGLSSIGLAAGSLEGDNYQEFYDSDFLASHSVEVVSTSPLISVNASIMRETALQDRQGNWIAESGYITTDVTVLDTPKFSTDVPYTLLLTSSDGKEIAIPMMAYVPGSQVASAASINPGGTSSADITESYATPFDGRQTVSGSFSFTDANASGYSLEIYGDGSSIPDDFTASVVGGAGGGTVQWSYSIAESYFQSLAPNTNFIRSFGIAVSDDIGGGVSSGVYISEHSRPGGTSIVAGSEQSTGGPNTFLQGSTSDGKHLVSGSFDFIDPDPRDVHTVASYIANGGIPGDFEAHVETDTNGGGTGRVVWSYTVTDDQIGPFPGDYSATFEMQLDDGRGGQQAAPVDVSVGAKAVFPAVAPVIAASPATMTVWAGGYQSYATGYNTYTDQDTRIHHTISTSFAGTGAALGTMFASLADTTYGSTQQSPTGSYSLIYTVDPTALNAMQDGQVVTETWHVTLGSDYGLTSTQDETVVIQRQNATAIDTTHIYNGTVQAGAVPADWTMPPGAFLFTDRNALEAHTVTSSFKSSSMGGGPLGTFSTNMLYDTWNSPFGEGILGWNYDASHVRPWSHTPQAVVETWTVNLNDGHGGITSQDVQVTIDVPASNNQAPVVGAIAVGSVSQNAAPVHVDLLSTSSDPDAGDTLSIVANSLTVSSSDGHAVIPLMGTDGHTATIDPAAFAYLAAGEHADLVFNFDVTDGIDTTHGTATMTVTGVDDAPTAVGWASGGTVGENVADNSVIGQLKAFDPDHNDTFVWALQTNEDHLFAVSSSGQVTTVNGEAMDHNIYPNGYDIAVTATDAGGLSVTQTVHIGQGSTAGATITDTTGGLTLTGTAGDDVITGGHGDTINAGAGNDLVVLGDDGSTLNQVDGGTGINTIDLSTRSAAVNLNLQNGQFVDLNGHATGENATHFNNVVGTSYNDRFYTTSDYNHVSSGAGNDAIVGYGYNDYIDGGDGFDVVSFAGTTQDINVNLKTGATSLAYAHETLVNIEGVVGGSGNDTIVLPDAGVTWGSSGSTPLNGGYVQEASGNNTITGGNGNDQIYGGTGNDTIYGGAGIDVISGGGGNDIITGGAGNDGISVSHPGGLGNDQFNYAFGDGTDTINGFLQGNDTINIARIAGKADPVVTIGPNGFATDVHVTWYDTTPVQGQPLPNHVDADILLHGVLLNSFVAGQDYHLI